MSALPPTLRKGRSGSSGEGGKGGKGGDEGGEGGDAGDAVPEEGSTLGPTSIVSLKPVHVCMFGPHRSATQLSQAALTPAMHAEIQLVAEHTPKAPMQAVQAEVKARGSTKQPDKQEGPKSNLMPQDEAQSAKMASKVLR